jgi:dienelactone hydrolase
MKPFRSTRVNSRQWLLSVTMLRFLGSMLTAIALSASAADGISTEASAEGPAQTAYASANGPGRVAIVISGQTGPASYQTYAAELAKLGYYAVLVDGKDILNRTQWPDAPNLRKVIERSQRSPSAIPGKVAVVSFSLGGGGALLHATAMPDSVSMVVAYYPFTREWADKLNWFVKRFRVPVLVLAAERDRYKECCVVETARAMDIAAKSVGARFELVVYPEADHGFNLQTGAQGEPASAYRRDDDRDAWRRTVEMLKQHQPSK